MASSSNKSVLVIGATGMLGRPVVRRLVKDSFTVRALARDLERARAVLPQTVDLKKGDLSQISSIEAALEGMDAVYLSVDTRPGDKFQPETDGLRNLTAAMKNFSATRLLVLSALGVSKPEAKNHPWKTVRRKAEAQEIAQNSGFRWTIFEPTWFMESLPLFCKNGAAMGLSGINFSSYWVSGDDYGRVIAAALQKNIGENEVIPVQGLEKIEFKKAQERFIAAYDPKMSRKVIPFWALKALGLFIPQVKELAAVLKMSSQIEEVAPDLLLWDQYAKPQMTVETYASYSRQTADFPQKN